MKRLSLPVLGVPLLFLPLLASACLREGGRSLVPDDTGPEEPLRLTSLGWRLHDTVQSFAVVSWVQSDEATVHLEYRLAGEDWRSSPSWTLSAGAHEQVLVGIPYASTAEWGIVAETGESAQGEDITTGPLPEGLPTCTVTRSEPDAWLPEGRYLLTSINEDVGGWTQGTYWAFVIDRECRVIWANETPDKNWTLYTQVSVSGDHILWDESTRWAKWDDGAASVVHKAWLDEEFEVVGTPGLHHEFIEMPDLTLAWGSKVHAETEALVTMAPGEEAEVLWTCEDDWPDSGQCESNCLFYSEDRDTFLYSFYTNDSLVEIDATTGENLWWAGGMGGGYAFDPEDSQFDWQHGVTWTDAGTLLLSTRAGTYEALSTMVREYEVDPANATLHQVWSYDPGVLAGTNGDAWRLSNGNTLHVIGSAGLINEVDPEGVPVWTADFASERLLGRGQLIDDLFALLKPAG